MKRNRKIVLKVLDVKEGDEVLLAVNKKTVKLGNGMKERWEGPFKVEAMSTKGVSTLVDSQGISKRRQKVNVRHLKPYVRRTDTAEDVDIASLPLTSRN